MISIAKIKSNLQVPTTVPHLASKLNCKQKELEPIIEHWILKGKIIICQPNKCHGCPIACKKFLQWTSSS